MLPNSVPIIVVTVIWQFTNIWNDFLFGASFSGCRQPADDGGAEQPRQHLDRREGIQRRTSPAAIIAALPTLLVYIVAGRYFVRGLMAGAVKG